MGRALGDVCASGVPWDVMEPRERAEPPIDPSDGDAEVVIRPHDSTRAAGVDAVTSTVAVTLRQAGWRSTLPLLAKLNQRDGFDCPSCAWPDPKHRSVAEFCENGAKAAADAASSARLTPEWLATQTIDELAARSDQWFNDAGRLTAPVVRRKGSDRYEPISWEDALAMAGDRLASLPDPNRAAFYTSGRASNEAAFMYQLFVRELGTNNLPDCSNMCHESSGVALAPTVGIGKGSVTLEDIEVADVVIVIGQNPGTNAPRMLTALQRVVEHGGSIVSVNPMRERGLVGVRNPQDFSKPWRWAKAVSGQDLASMFVRVVPGGDLAFLIGVQKALFVLDETTGTAIDHEFVASHVDGIDAVAESVRADDWSILEAASGVAREEMEALAGLLAANTRIVWCWAMGLTQHERAVDTIRQIVNLALLRGAIGIPGAGLCPVRGHSNVQGDRTVGIYDKPSEAFLARLGDVVGFDPPRRHGYDVVETIEAMHRGDVDVYVSLGGNLLSAAPDTAFTADAFSRVGLCVSIVTKLNRGHLVAGEESLVLPCLARPDRDRSGGGGGGGKDQFVTTENSMGIVTRSRGHLAPPSTEVRSEVAIVAALARATFGDRSVVDWEHLSGDYDRIRDLIEAVIPGFDDYNERVRRPDGIELPNSARRRDFSGLAGGRAKMTSVPFAASEGLPDDALMLMTIRSHDQFNTTVYGNDDRYRGVHGGRRVVFVNADDASARGVGSGDVVDVVGVDDGGSRRAERFTVVEYDLPRGTCAAYFPEANVLVPIHRVAAGSKTPVSKAVPVRLVTR